MSELIEFYFSFSLQTLHLVSTIISLPVLPNLYFLTPKQHYSVTILVGVGGWLE